MKGNILKLDYDPFAELSDEISKKETVNSNKSLPQ